MVVLLCVFKERESETEFEGLSESENQWRQSTAMLDLDWRDVEEEAMKKVEQWIREWTNGRLDRWREGRAKGREEKDERDEQRARREKDESAGETPDWERSEKKRELKEQRTKNRQLIVLWLPFLLFHTYISPLS